MFAHAADDNAGIYGFAIHTSVGIGDGVIGKRLTLHRSVASKHAVGRNDHLAGGIDNAVGKRIRGKAAENDRVYCADPGAGEHRDGQFGDHWHIYGNAVSLSHASRLKHVGEFADLMVEFPVRQPAVFTRFIAFPDDRNLISPCFQVTVEAIVGNAGLRTFKPFDVDGSFVDVVVVCTYVIPFSEPVEVSCYVSPECIDVLYGFLITPLVFFETIDMRPATEILRREISSALFENPVWMCSH